MPQSTCWPRDTLKDYLNGSADDQRLEAIESHLAQCQVCEQTILELEREPETLLAVIREHVQERPSSESQAKSDDDAPASVIKRAVDAVRELGGRPSASPSPLEKPGQIRVQQIGAYELVRPLGRGGMGLVMLARHATLKKQVAVKILPGLIGDRPELVQRFQREIITAGQLNHPSIVHATDAGAEQGTHYLVMEYIDGLDLSRIARLGSPLTIADACEMMRQAALGLSYAHAQGVVHRDVKPSNLMLDTAGRVKILDFGLAQLNLWDEAAAELTTVGQLMGTLDYMAPEQAERVGPVDYRADLYALGATLFRLLTGRAPLAASPNMTLLEKVRLLGSQSAPLVSTLRDESPVALVQLIEQLLSRDPAARPASAAHVAEALSPFCVGHDLSVLLDKSRERAALQADHEEALPLGPMVIATPPTIEPPRRSYWALAWLAPLAILAGILITIETQKGQLVIESEVPGIKVNVLQDGKVYEQLQVLTGAQSTRLFADKYAIEIDGASDGVAIDRTNVEVRRGSTVVARITQKSADEMSAEKYNVAKEILARKPGVLRLDRVALATALQELSERLQVPITYDAADLASVGVTTQSKTGLMGIGQSVDAETALRVLLYRFKLVYTVSNDSIIVGSRERIEKIDGQPFTRWLNVESEFTSPSAGDLMATDRTSSNTTSALYPQASQSNNTESATTREQAADPSGQNTAPFGPVKPEPMYAGQTLSQWLNVLERDLDLKTRLSTLPAIERLSSSAGATIRERINQALVATIVIQAQEIVWGNDGPRLLPQDNAGLSSVLDSLVSVNGGNAAFQLLQDSLLKNGHVTLSTIAILSALNKYKLVQQACNWLLSEGRLQDLEGPVAWAAFAFLENSLRYQDASFFQALPKIILDQPQLGVPALLLLEPAATVQSRPEGTQLEEAIARIALNAFIDDQSSPQTIAMSAHWLARTTSALETHRQELVPKIRDRLQQLAADDDRLLAAVRIVEAQPDIKTESVTQSPRGFGTGPASSLTAPFGFNATGINDMRRGFRLSYSRSEVIGLLELVVRLTAIKELDDALTQVATRVFENALPLAGTIRRGDLRVEAKGWPFDEEQVRRMPKPYDEFSPATWRAAKLATTIRSLPVVQMSLFDTKLLTHMLGYDADLLIAERDKNGDDVLSKAEASDYYSWNVDADKDNLITKDELILNILNNLMRDYVRQRFGDLHLDSNSRLARSNAIPAISATQFSAIDADKNDELSLSEFVNYGMQHPIPPATATVPSTDQPTIKLQFSAPNEDVVHAWAERQINKYDKNKDGVLTEDEWKTMIIPPRPGTDANGDGQITCEEYATQQRLRSGP